MAKTNVKFKVVTDSKGAIGIMSTKTGKLVVDTIYHKGAQIEYVKHGNKDFIIIKDSEIGQSLWNVCDDVIDTLQSGLCVAENARAIMDLGTCFLEEKPDSHERYITRGFRRFEAVPNAYAPIAYSDDVMTLKTKGYEDSCAITKLWYENTTDRDRKRLSKSQALSLLNRLCYNNLGTTLQKAGVIEVAYSYR